MGVIGFWGNLYFLVSLKLVERIKIIKSLYLICGDRNLFGIDICRYNVVNCVLFCILMLISGSCILKVVKDIC